MKTKICASYGLKCNMVHPRVQIQMFHGARLHVECDNKDMCILWVEMQHGASKSADSNVSWCIQNVMRDAHPILESCLDASNNLARNNFIYYVSPFNASIPTIFVF